MPICIYPIPDGEPLSDSLELKIDGQPVPVHMATVSAIPYNRRWPGHQRTIDQAEEAYFALCSADSAVSVEVSVKREFSEAVVRPLRAGVTPERNGRNIRFTLPSPGYYTLELDGYHNALHIFIDPQNERQPRPGNEVLRFEAGVHDIGILRLCSNQTVQLDSGAIVYGCIHAENAENIEIIGRGILDNSRNTETILFQPEEQGSGMTAVKNCVREHTIKLTGCRNITVDGITIRDSLLYNITTYGCEYFTAENVKIIGCWRYNSDGIDLHNTCHARIYNCFVRSFDDSICVKAFDSPIDLCDDITVERCVVWNDWDHALEIGAETSALELKNIRFIDCDVIHSTCVVLSICNVDRGHVHDVTYENICVEYDAHAPRPQIQPDDDTPFSQSPDDCSMADLINMTIFRHHEYSQEDRRGRISDIRFSDISVISPGAPLLSFTGYDREHMVSGVRIRGLTVNGTPVRSFDEVRFYKNDFCADIELA